MTEKLRAFVIMPFDQEFTSIYESLIRDSLIEAGYEVMRADSFLNQENILRTIVREISTTDLVVADLTTNNPNVFYELGLAHALRKPTVLLAQTIADVPFDLRSYKIHVYETHFGKIDKLKNFLKKLGKQHARGEISFANPVDDFAEVEPPPEAVSQSNSIDHHVTRIDDNRKELWDFLGDGETASVEMRVILARLGKENEAIAQRLSRHVATLESLKKNPTIGSARKFQKVFLITAADMNNFAGKIEGQMPALEDAIDRVNQNYSGFIRLVDPSNEENRQALLSLRNQIENLLGNVRDAKEVTRSFEITSRDIADQKLSQNLSRASRRQADALKGLIANIDRVESFCVKAVGMIDDTNSSVQ